MFSITWLAFAGCNDQTKPPVASNSESWGEFPSKPKLEAMDNGRDFDLLEDFAYVDPRQRVWTAPQGWTVNGASIPSTFWSLVGGPMSGKFRNASVVHDVACDRKTETWESVHLMFYEGCRCGGVPEAKAKLMYAAVYHFGPRWKIREVSESRVASLPDGTTRTITVTRKIADDIEPPPTIGDSAIAKLQKFIDEKNPDIKQLQEMQMDSFVD